MDDEFDSTNYSKVKNYPWQDKPTELQQSKGKWGEREGGSQSSPWDISCSRTRVIAKRAKSKNRMQIIESPRERVLRDLGRKWTPKTRLKSFFFRNTCFSTWKSVTSFTIPVCLSESVWVMTSVVRRRNLRTVGFASSCRRKARCFGGKRNYPKTTRPYNYVISLQNDRLLLLRFQIPPT